MQSFAPNDALTYIGQATLLDTPTFWSEFHPQADRAIMPLGARIARWVGCSELR